MKNRLLAAMALCAATSSTMPLWAAEWADPTLQTATPDLENTADKDYYIYHPYSGMWMTAGNDWGTAWSVGEVGQMVTLEYNIDYILGNPEKEGTYVEGYESVYGWRMSMYNAPSNSGFHEIWVSGATRAFVDHNQQGHMLWQFKKLDNGNYKIKVKDEDPKFGYNSGDPTLMNGYVGVPQASEQTFIYPCIDIDQAGYEEYDAAGLEWQFVEAAVYRIFVAKKAMQKVLLKAEEVEGFVIPTEYADMYNGTTATADEIEKATEQLQDDMVAFQYSLASPENPIDLTSKVTNADFSTGNTNGWTVEGSWGFCTRNDTNFDGRTMSNYPEKWVLSSENLADHSIYQTVKGLPNGKYRVSADIHLDKQNNTETVVEGYYLFGKGLGQEVTDTQPIPADPAGASTVAVTHTAEFSVVDGTATIGVRFKNVVGNWSGVDNFQLFYLGGDGGAGAKGVLEEFISIAETKLTGLQDLGINFSQAGEDRYNAYIDYAKGIFADTEVEDSVVIDAVRGLQFEMDTLDIDVAAYDELHEYINGENTGWARWENSPEYGDLDMPNYEAYIDGLETDMDDRKFDPKGIGEVAATADSIFTADVLAAALDATEEFNLTPMIVNPNFDGDSKTGWTGMDQGVSWSVAELYNGTCDIYQDITGLPEGTYKVSCQGFYRPGINDVIQAAWGVDGDTTNDVLGYLYANEGKNKLKHCYDEVFEVGHTGDVQITGIVDEAYNGKYVPNSRQGCSEAFAEGAYMNEVICYVGKDGKLRIGIKVEGATLAGNWVPFDNFKLMYVPDGGVQGLQLSLTNGITTATEMRDDTESVSTTEARTALDDAITTAQALVDEASTDGDALRTALEGLTSAIELGNTSVDKMDELTTLVEDEAGKCEDGDYVDYEDNVTDLYYEFYEYLADDLYDAIEEDFATVDAIQEAIDKVHVLKSNMIQGGLNMSEATGDAPVDVTALIYNPNFSLIGSEGTEENSSEGWTIEGEKGKGNVGALNAGCIESWNSKNFDIHQTIINLQAGNYKLSCKAFYRMCGNNEALMAVRDGVEKINAFLYAQIGDEYTQNALPSVYTRLTEAKTDAGDYVVQCKKEKVKDTLLVGGLAEYANYKYLCVVNNMVGVNTAFKEADSYNAQIFFKVPEGGADVQIGVRKEEGMDNDWTIWDRFKLEYYGSDIPGAIEGVLDGNAQVVASSWYTIAGVQVPAPTKRGFYIREDIMSDGTKQAVKVFVQE